MTDQDIIIALCDVSGRCTVCYRPMNGMNCSSCDEYYTDCGCKPMTRKQIEENDYEID